MRRFFTVFVLISMPALILAGNNRFQNGINYTQQKDWVFGMNYTGSNFKNPAVFYYLTDRFAPGLRFSYNHDKTTLPNDDIQTQSSFGFKVYALYEICGGDNGPVIFDVAPYLGIRMDKSTTKDAVDTESSTSWFNFGANIGAKVFLTKQFALGIGSRIGFQSGSEKNKTNGNSQDGNKYFNYKVKMNPNLGLYFNFN